MSETTFTSPIWVHEDILYIANGHLRALEKLETMEGRIEVFNLGTGCGYSVLEVVQGFERALGKPLNYGFAPRRVGDCAKLVANITKAEKELGYKITKTLDDMCGDSVHFIQKRFK